MAIEDKLTLNIHDDTDTSSLIYTRSTSIDLGIFDKKEKKSAYATMYPELFEILNFKVKLKMMLDHSLKKYKKREVFYA